MSIKNGQTLDDVKEKLEEDGGKDYPIIESKHSITENSHERKVRSPMVQAHGTYNQYCVFDDDQNNWCLISTGDMLTVGWKVVQYTTPANNGVTTGNYSIAFRPYI